MHIFCHLSAVSSVPVIISRCERVWNSINNCGLPHKDPLHESKLPLTFMPLHIFYFDRETLCCCFWTKIKLGCCYGRWKEYVCVKMSYDLTLAKLFVHNCLYIHSFFRYIFISCKNCRSNWSDLERMTQQ